MGESQAFAGQLLVDLPTTRLGPRRRSPASTSSTPKFNTSKSAESPDNKSGSLAAVDAVFDSVRWRRFMGKPGITFCSFSEAVLEHPG